MEFTKSSIVTLGYRQMGQAAVLQLSGIWVVTNEGIGTGEVVDISDNPLDCDDPTTRENIEVLVGREVALTSECL